MAPVWLAALPLTLALTLSVPGQEPQAEPQRLPQSSIGCIGVPRNLSDRPVADAISAVPNLSKLADGIDSSGLRADLNTAPQVTVFAPVNEAFGNLAGQVPLDRTGLRYYVVPQRINPDRLVGTHRTLQGGALSVTRANSRVKVNGAAALTCNRVQAANGNVYLLDALLTPR